jgi:DHA2 family multidrug resistance protein
MAAVAFFGAVLSGTSARMGGLLAADINGGLGVSANEGSWIVTAHDVGQILIIPLVALLASTLSMRRLALFAGIGLAVTSIAATAVDSLAAMIALRGLHGVFGGAMLVIMMVIIMAKFPPGKGRNEGLVVYAFSTSFPAGIAALIGGALASVSDGTALFEFQAVWALAYAGLVYAIFTRQAVDLPRLLRADWLSYALLVTGLGMLVVTFSQGNRRFWFENEIIVFTTVAGGVLLALAIVSLLTRPQPLLDLKLLKIPTFGIGLLLAVFLRFGLMVSAFVVPQYLTRLAGYRVEQIADVMAVMIPAHLVAFPLAYLIATRLDARLTLSAGLWFFAVSAWMNASLTPEWAASEFQPSLIVLAFGQAFFVLSVLYYATFGLGPPAGPTASTLFNLTRVMGQAVGTATMATLVTEREKFHSNRIVEHLNNLGDQSLERLDHMARIFSGVQSDPAVAQLQALRTLSHSAANQAFTIAYQDAFQLITVLLVIGGTLAWMMPKIDLRQTRPSVAKAIPSGSQQGAKA